ncbi:MAG: hypothetical protein IPK67_19225 [Planctomycetes bacterium]|nr:hypothetical protein [Planctomycetota bacterium]
MLDRFALYELCVQAPLLQAAFLGAVHGGRPLLLREDFSGRAAPAARLARPGRTGPRLGRGFRRGGPGILHEALGEGARGP